MLAKEDLIQESQQICLNMRRKINIQKIMITNPKGRQKARELIRNDNVRKVEYPFGWIPQRFVTDGIMKALPAEEILLYVFLSLVSDRNGISFYGDKRIGELTGMSIVDVITARFGLEKKGFIAYKKPYYQILQMPRSISCT